MSTLDSKTEPDPDFEQLDILLVEDDAGDAVLFQEHLHDIPVATTVRWVTTLAKAMAMLKERAPMCIVLDLHLPDAAEGVGAVTLFQEACPVAAVVVLTGLSDEATGIEAVRAGAQDYLVKDQVTGSLLHRVLRYSVQRKQAEIAAADARQVRVRAEENSRLEHGLLPTPLLMTTDASTPTITTRYRPSRLHALLGGDFLDVVQTPDGIVHALIGDVCGHGPAEAALGVCLRVAWRTLILTGMRGADLFGLLENVLIAERGPGNVFATCTALDLDPVRHTVQVISAGHPAPLLITSGVHAAELDTPHGIALGIAPNHATWPVTTVALPEAGALMLYTDGLIEGHTGHGHERLETEGLIGLIADTPPAIAAQPALMLDYLIRTTHFLDADRHADDLAVLHLDWTRSAR
ncbi:MAG TPA: SpoIIE family protein phosphatase [Actinocrinis sp.]|nr:SpoIIE family protein phosphatase [Actinocrinis sp.]